MAGPGSLGALRRSRRGGKRGAGMLNEHPRIAIALRDSAKKDEFTEFYDMLTTPEPGDDAGNDK